MAPKRRLAVHRRPAARASALKRPAKDVKLPEKTEPEAGKKRRFADVNPRDLLKLGPICLEDAIYYGKTSPVAGRITGIKSEGDEIYFDLKASGTKSEELLRILSGRADKKLTVHSCGSECQGLLTDELLVHAREFEEVELGRVPWLTNLMQAAEDRQEEDELAQLRLEQQRLEAEKKRMEKKERLKDKKQKRREEKEEGRRDKSPKEEREEELYGQKDLDAIFKGTGLDPEPRRRAKIMKKARRVLAKGRKKKKKAKSDTSKSKSSSSTTSSSSSNAGFEDGLFDEEHKLQTVWRRYPGSLTAKSLQEIRRSLLTSAGTMWQVDRTALPPLYTQYGRQEMIPSMSPSLQQEALTLCQALDFILQGRVAGGVDILNQRLKSIAALAKGAHSTLGRQYELVKVDERGFAEGGEVLAAARRAKEDEKLRGLLTRASSGKGGDAPQTGKGKKGKESKGTYKNQSVEGSKGKGGGSGKEDKKETWQKK